MKININNILIDNVTMKEAVEQVIDFTSLNTTSYVFTPNSEIIMQAQRDKELLNILNSASLLVPDGAGVLLGAKILKTPLKEKVSGIDLTKNLFKVTNKNLSFYLLGGKPGIPEKAALNIVSEYQKTDIKGYNHGYFNVEDTETIIDNINKSNAKILLVGLGAPKQEKWIYDNLDKLSVNVCIGIGGSFDVFAGEKKLAPEFIRKIGFEWLYRLIKEPWRFKRMLDLPKFVFLSIKNSLGKKQK